MKVRKLITLCIFSMILAGCKDKESKFLGVWKCQDCNYDATITISEKDNLFYLDYHGFAPKSIFVKEPEQKEQYIAKAEAEDALVLQNVAPNISNIILKDSSFEFKKRSYKRQ